MNVENDAGGRARFGGGKKRRAFGEPRDLIARPRQHDRQRIEHHRIVVDDKDFATGRIVGRHDRLPSLPTRHPAQACVLRRLQSDVTPVSINFYARRSVLRIAHPLMHGKVLWAPRECNPKACARPSILQSNRLISLQKSPPRTRPTAASSCPASRAKQSRRNCSPPAPNAVPGREPDIRLVDQPHCEPPRVGFAVDAEEQIERALRLGEAARGRSPPAPCRTISRPRRARSIMMRDEALAALDRRRRRRAA